MFKAIGRRRPNKEPSSNARTLIIWAVECAIFGCLVSDTRAVILTPPYFNLAEGKNVTASATCGQDTEGPELYCKLVGANAESDININLIQGQTCDVCDPNDPKKSHLPRYAVDGLETWWQSPPLSRGMKYNEVNLTIDLGQEFHVAYVYIRMGNSPRPGLWVLEKSLDYGKTYVPWQYFSDSRADCERYFGRESLKPITRDDSVICSTEYSKIVPLEGGEIPISLLNNRPSANMYFNSTVLQEWTRATNVRLRMLRTKNLLGHLMSVARQDPTVTRRYFYSIKDISIGGRCMCNGHADTCDPDPRGSSVLMCRCQHSTCGPQCAECCPGFRQKAWRQSTGLQRFVCEPCNCFNHTNECIYDADTDMKHLSLDIHGNYAGGGVCQNCQHNTEGINCNRCKPTFYRPNEKRWNETDVCQPCECDPHFSTGNCQDGTGKCECRPEYLSPNCDECSRGYFGYPNCKPCECNINGTRGAHCEAHGGQCPCKQNYAGKFCDECADGYYNFPECLPCNCNPIGSTLDICEKVTGNCSCHNNFGGRSCDRCEIGFYNYPECTYCRCEKRGTLPHICDDTTGECACREGFGGPQCSTCAPSYYGYPSCTPCACSVAGSMTSNCDITSGACACLNNFAGRTCEQCRPGYYQYPDCLDCNCDTNGAIGESCDGEGKCQCLHNFDNNQCNQCKEGYYNFPICEECNCNPAGVVAAFAGCGSVPAGELCQCKERVFGRICDVCRPLYWNLSPSNPDGCEDCQCHIPGVIGGISTCDTITGQCMCKSSVTSRTCAECADGSYSLREDDLFGCTDCGCDVGGSIDSTCDKNSGQCSCKPRVAGLRCTEPLPTHFFPTLHQFQYEAENGRTPDHSQVRYGFAEDLFPNYSWKGYAVFSAIQNEIIQNILIRKPSLYRMVMRYVNLNPDTVVGSIKITPDSAGETEQKFQVAFKPTQKGEPAFVTVGDLASSIPAAMVMNPGRWSISIKNNMPLMLDYFVLLPAAYYEATILTQNIENPCTIENKGLCRHYSYPNISGFDTVRGEGGFVSDGDDRVALKEYYSNQKHLHQLGETQMPLLNANQSEIQFELMISKPTQYILLITYTTPENATRGADVSVEAFTSRGRHPARAILNACPYTSLCRQAVIDRYRKVAVFNFDTNHASVRFRSDNNSEVAIKSVVAIPLHEWTIDYVTAAPVCIRSGRDKDCITSTFPVAPDTKKVPLSHDENATIILETPYFNKTIRNVTFLNQKNPMVDIGSQVPHPGYYVFVVHYYQPDHPAFTIDVLIQNGLFYEGKLPINHCPSVSGCRAIVEQTDGNTRFNLTENFVLSLKEPSDKSVYLEYLLVIPSEVYTDRILDEQRFDQTKQFLTNCDFNHFHINTSTEGFCRDAVFSLTSDYNNGALPCQCDSDGSLSFECKKFGGQCPCKENVIGRQCVACKTGYFGFPDCRPCNCPSTAQCETTTGACICPSRVTGKLCDQCEPNTYGFDPIIGCEDCRCSALGVVRNNMQCDLTNGSCTCKPNVVGRTCNRCAAGNYGFPYCEECECDYRGTLEEVCDQQTAECLCKANTHGHACDLCKDGTFDLQETNPDGCSKCFCFGKTSRCTSSSLYRSRVVDMNEWQLASLEMDNHDVMVTILDEDLEQLNETTVAADFSADSPEELVTYFAAPESYLGNKLTAYGGNLAYTIFFTTGVFGDSVIGPDMIIHGANTFLMHYSIEQPAPNTEWNSSIAIIESNFFTANGLPATRETLMVALEDLEGIYIRAKYYQASITTRLIGASLDTASESYTPYADPAHGVEQCACPQNYDGLSCEKCAKGFYRVSAGPFGGYCVPCQCNGHSDECDVNTGTCFNCQHDTTGSHCEMCDVGFHGNATHGTPVDCLICACPLPIASNNFATACDVTPDGERISCTCKKGYWGARCESCAAGYYGRPEITGEFCKPCDCSGNINPEEPGSCDSVTGECRMCLNNTFGAACNLCKPGYFGDAIHLKDCQSCICSELGTDHCDSYTGLCSCLPNVEGEKCDKCVDEHYGFSSGLGCSPCACGIASESARCDDESGKCRCAPGVVGRACDRCHSGFWNYTETGCISCGCHSGYSVGVGCNARTGQCECLPGVIGEKCDHCPHRWVLVPEEGCFSCDNCVHALLDVTDSLSVVIEPIIVDLDNITEGYFTSQKLSYINETVTQLAPEVKLLDPSRVNLSPLVQQLEGLEQDSRNLKRKTEYAIDTSNSSIPRSNDVRIFSRDVLDTIKQEDRDARNIVDEVVDLISRFEAGTIIVGARSDQVLKEAQTILEAINAKNLTEWEHSAQNQTKKANDLVDKINNFSRPIRKQEHEISTLKNDIDDFDERLDEMQVHSREVLDDANAVNILNTANRDPRVMSKVQTAESKTAEAHATLADAGDLLKNASGILNDARKTILKLERGQLEQARLVNELNDTVAKRYQEREEVLPKLLEAQNHATNLTSKAQELDGLLSDTRYTSEHAVDAANAYKNIVEAIENARSASDESDTSALTAENMSIGLANRTSTSESKSIEMLNDAINSLKKVQTELEPKLNQSKLAVEKVAKMVMDGNKTVSEIQKGADKITVDEIEPIVEEVNEASEAAGGTARETLTNMKRMTEELPEGEQRAKELPKIYEDTKNNIASVKEQLLKVHAFLPNISNLMESVKPKTEYLQQDVSNIEDKINRLNQLIAEARDEVNRIKVGVHFYRNTTLQARNPPTLSQQTLSTKVSAYFKTANPNGFLVYLGNENSTKARRPQQEDFMALEIENGYPILTIDLGNGPEKIINNKYVADNKWYQVIVERLGQNVTLTIRDQDASGKELLYSKMEKLQGPNTVFNLDQERSKLYIGGYPPNAELQLNNRESAFEGEIEDVVIGDTPISLWNFVDANQISNGANERDRLLNIQPTGYRFGGNGYAVIDATGQVGAPRNSIVLNFKTRDPNGLLFLMKGADGFLSVELKDGHILYQYKINEDEVRSVWSEAADLNDDEWHSVEVIRIGHDGQIRVDGNSTRTRVESSARTELYVEPKMYFGGYPSNHHIDEVTNKGFDGCIDNVIVSSNPIDLSASQYVFDVLPGCPKKFAGIVSFSEAESYLKYDDAPVGKAFQMTLKFMAKPTAFSSNGILFYTTNDLQNETLSLALIDGNLVLQNQQNVVQTSGIALENGVWHIVTATNDHRTLELIINDIYNFSTSQNFTERKLSYTHLFFGGIPYDVNVPNTAVQTRESFNGCIEDVTLNGQIVNFANSTDKYGETLGSCTPIGDIDHHLPSGPLYPGEIDVEQFTPAVPHTTIDDDDDRPPQRGDGGDSDFERTTSVTTTSTTTTTRRPTTTSTEAPQPERQCYLPPYPEYEVGFEAGYRFGGKVNSWLEYDQLPHGRHKNKFDFSLDFKTNERQAVLFYSADAQHVHFISLFLSDGKVNLRFNTGSDGVVNIASQLSYNDGRWHSVDFARYNDEATLHIDGDLKASGTVSGPSKNAHIKPPYYVGGTPSNISNELTVNLSINNTFVGCIRDFKHIGHDVGEPKLVDVLPCSENIESGVFFEPRTPNGGYLKLRDRFKVGIEMNINMEIKPRNLTGLLLAVHGKRDFLVLQMINGSVRFTVNNGKGPFEAEFTPANEHYLCDGNWHSIFALKSKNVVTLAVDNVHAQPKTGSGHLTNTQNGLFIGGHPYLSKLRGFAASRVPYSGCMRNVRIDGKVTDLNEKNAYGDAWLHVCPTV